VSPGRVVLAAGVIATLAAGAACIHAVRSQRHRDAVIHARLRLQELSGKLTDVNQHLLEARMRTSNFDAITRDFEAIRQLSVSSGSELDGVAEVERQAVENVLVDFEDQVERLKSTLAVLRNSRRTFAVLTSSLRTRPEEVSSLARDLELLQLDIAAWDLGDVGDARALRARVASLTEQAQQNVRARSVLLALRHAENVLHLARRADSQLALVQRHVLHPRVEGAAIALEDWTNREARVQAHQRNLFAVFMLLLLGTVAWAARELRRRTSALAETAKALEVEKRQTEALNDDLEKRVEQRTTELANRNLELTATVKELDQVRGQLIFSERMATVGTLAAGVAHEINNPAAYVLANVTWVREQLEQRGREAETRELVSGLRDAEGGASRISKIVQDLKVFARADDGPPEPVELSELLRQSIAIATPSIRGRAQIAYVPSSIPLVAGSAARLGQVFLNLLVNAGQAIEEGNPAQNRVSIETKVLDGHKVEVCISDTGCGMSPETMNRIFDPFFTTKKVGVGTGLGLSICHGIVQSIGGSIQVQSTVGKGSRFRVILACAARTAVAQPKIAQSSTGSTRGMVLVVDDEPQIGESMKRLLGRDHEVRAVHSVDAGLSLIQEGTRFDVVLCDLMMPGKTGQDFYETLSNVAPGMAERVVFVSGGATSQKLAAFAERLAERVLAKPIDIKALRRLVSDRVRLMRA
jgi:signal transduction histidine kinase/CheY-like chemotaxis protein